MKTPRQILLQQHELAIPKLDYIRAAVMAGESPSGVSGAKHLPRELPSACLLKLWGELIWPFRRTWAGFAAMWIGLLAFNLLTAEPVQNSPAYPSPVEIAASIEQRRQLLAELFPPRARRTRIRASRRTSSGAESCPRERWSIG